MLLVKTCGMMRPAHSPSSAMRRLLGRMSVQVSSRYLSHSSLAAQTPVSSQPPGTSRSAGHSEYCSSWLIRTLNRASGLSKSKLVVRTAAPPPGQGNQGGGSGGPAPFVLAQEMIGLDAVLGAPGHELRDLL